MKYFQQNVGLILIIIGTLTLVLTRLPALNAHNSLLVAGLVIIVAGGILHIRSIKHDSRF